MIKSYRKLASFLIALSLSGCSLAESMKNMEKNTTEMNSTTKSLVSSIDKMDGTMQNMNTDMGSVKNNMTKMTADIDERLAVTMEKMDARMEEMNTKLAATQEVMEKKLAVMMEQMATALTTEMVPTMREMRDQMGALQTEIKTQLAQTNQSIQKLTETIDGKMLTKMDDLAKSVGGLNKVIETKLVSLMAQMNKTMSKDLLGAMNQMVSHVQELGVDMKAMRGQMGDLNGELRLMVDTTSSMDKKMGTMTSEIGGMSSKMNALPKMLTHLEKMTEIIDNIAKLVPSLKESMANQSREISFDGVKKADTMLGKFREATAWMSAFEYQLWLDDRDGSLDDLKKKGIADFVRMMRDLIEDEQSMHVDPLLVDNNHKSLQAIAAVLQETGDAQKKRISDCKNAKKANEKALCNDEEVTALSIIKEILRYRAKGPDGAPEYIKEGLLHEKQFIYLLQLRYNFLAALAISQLRHVSELKSKSESNGWQYALESWEIGSITTGAVFGSIYNLWQNYVWNIGSDSLQFMTERDFEFVQEALERAISTRNFIKKVDIEPVIDYKLATLFKISYFKSTGMFDATDAAQVRRLKKMTEAFSTIDEFNKDKGSVSMGVKADENGIL